MSTICPALTISLDPTSAVSLRAPSSFRLSTVTSPSITSDDEDVIEMLSGNGNLDFISQGNNANEGLNTILGPSDTGIPRYVAIGVGGMLAPRSRRISAGAKYWSLSAIAAAPAGTPAAIDAAASNALFLHGE